MASEQTTAMIRKLAMGLKHLREAIHTLNPDVPLADAEMMLAALKEASEAQDAFDAWLLGDRQ